MAIYHLDIKAHSRSLNIHAIALSSYRSGEKLRCDADGKVRNCRREGKSTVLYKALLNNRGLNRERLWNKAEAAERRKDAVVAREMELGLPCELSLEEQKKLAIDMAEKISQKYDCAVDLTLHAPDKEGDHRNYHVHLLFTSRSWASVKDQSDRNFASRKYRDLNKATAKEEVLYWRGLWEEMVNDAYEKNGLDERVSSLSCEEQGKIKKYEHFDFEKYQHLRRKGELEEAKKASRLKQEIQREELLIEDLLDIRKELLKEKEVLLEKLKEIEEKEDGLRRGKQDFARAESRHPEEAENSGSESEQLDQESLSNGSDESGGSSKERSQRSERYFEEFGGYDDSGNGGMESGTGSKEDAKSHQESATIGVRLLELVTTAIKAIFKNKWLQKFKFFRKERFAVEQEYSQNQKAIDQKIVRGVKSSTFDLTMTAMKAESNRRSRRHEESLEVQKAIDNLRENFKESFINFQGLDIKKEYKTVVVAREEVRNIFGRLKSSRDVIIGFHRNFHMDNKKESAVKCDIEEVRNPKIKSNWKIYEIIVDDGQRLEDLLNEKCQGFELDPNLVQREIQIKSEWQKVVERQIKNLEKNGIRKSKLSISQAVSSQEKIHNRGNKR